MTTSATRATLLTVAVLLTAGRAGTQELRGSITGIVVSDGDAATPVRRAVVTASGPALANSRSAISDDEGRFTIDGIPAGSYSVVAARATFITSAYGAKRPARAGTPVMVTGGTATAIRLRLWRGAVVTGTIRNEFGEPLPGVPVRALPVKSVTPRYLSLDNNGSATDEAGRFRIFGLEPGQYLINALPSVGGATARTALADQYVDAMLNDLRSGGRVGQPRAPAAAVEAPTVVYSPVYYPGTARIEDAAPVTLGPGDTVEGLDIRFVHVPAVTVSGTVQFADGSPAGGVDVRMAAADRPRGTTNPLMADRRYSATTNSAGAFVIPHVPPGRYEIAATVRGSQESLTQPGSKEPSTLWAIDHVTVDGTQVSGLRLRVVPALTIRGRVQLQGRAGPLPATFAEARIAMILSTAPLPPTLRGSALGRLGPDGTFVIPDLRPDSEYRLVLDGVPEPWWPESALMAGTELLEGPVYMTGGLASNALTVILSSSPASLSGTLAGGTSVGDVFIVIFPAERERWSSERRTRGVQPDARGQYRVSGLPPGDYLVGVVGDADPDDWKNPTFLERVAQAAIPVTLGRGETRRLDLNLR